MPINFLYPALPVNFTRSYISGFVANTGIINMVLVGNVLSYDYLTPAIHLDLVIRPHFLPWSSNVYSLDYVFDAAASQAYVSGSPVSSSQGIRFTPMLTEPTYRISTIFGLGIDESLKVDLPAAPTGYWRPSV